MAEYKITLDGGPPWGIRLGTTGGNSASDPVQVSAVNPGSKAHRQGIEAGDQVTSINDHPVQDIEQAQQSVRNASSNLVLQLRRAPRAPSFSRPSRPTFICETRPAAASTHGQPPIDSNLDQRKSQLSHLSPQTSRADSSGSKDLPATSTDNNAEHPRSNSDYRPELITSKSTTESITGTIQRKSAESSTRQATMNSGNDGNMTGETRTFVTSGPPMSPQFKVRSGVKPLVWSPTGVRAPVAREYYPTSTRSVTTPPHHQHSTDQNCPSIGPSHSSLSTSTDDRSLPTSTHNGVYSPSSSSSGIMSATNSERTDEPPVRGEYEDRGASYRGNQEPHSVMFVERTKSDFSRLPRSQSPTVTLLQKAREGHLDKTPSYTQIDPHDREYKLISSVPSTRGDTEVIRHTFAAPQKYDDSGPTNEKGMPTALRSIIKDDKQHDWYKKMFKAIHKPEDETDFVLVKYQNARRRSGYSPTPKNQYLSDAYMSEPELGREDNYTPYSTASDIESSRDYSDFSRTHSLPRTKKAGIYNNNRQSETVANENPYRSRTSPPKGAPPVEPKTWLTAPQRNHSLPKRIDTYKPGHSSISMHEALQDRNWKREMDLYNPTPEKSVPNYSISTGSSGRFKPDQSAYRRALAAERAMSPEEKRDIYKEIQKGGEVPLSGLRMPAPQKPKEVNPNDLTSTEYAEWRKAFALKTLLPEAEAIEKFAWDLGPSLLSLAQVSVTPVLRAQPLTKFSFFKSTYMPQNTSDSANYARLFTDFNDVGRNLPRKNKNSDKSFSFFRALSGAADPFQPAKKATKGRRRANTLDSHSNRPTDVWLKSIKNDLRELTMPIEISKEKLEKISNPYFRNRLSFQLAVPPVMTPLAMSSCTFHSSTCGTLFSGIAHAQPVSQKIAQSKTIGAFPRTCSPAMSMSSVPAPERSGKGATSSLAVFQKRREQKMQRLKHKMFSTSKESASPTKSNFGRVKKLSQKYETWQLIRSASGSPIPGHRSRKMFSYTDAGALDVWTVKKDSRLKTSKSLSSIIPAADDPQQPTLIKSKSVLPGLQDSATFADNPYRHVGFELLESSLSLDDKMTSVSSFTDSGLEYFHRGSMSSLSSDPDGGLYRDIFLTDVDAGFLNGPDVQRMELDIDKISAPPAKKPLTDSASRNRSALDNINNSSSYYSTPVRPSTSSTIDRQSSRSTDYGDIEFDLQKEYKKIDEIYDREREKRQKSQARDEERRRHKYVPTMTKSPVPSDRYDSVYDDPFNFRPRRPRSVSPGLIGSGRRDRARSASAQEEYFFESDMVGPARALYNFTAQNPRELSFRQGDIVQVLRSLDQNWIEGTCNNRSGIAPASYLESMANDNNRRRMERVAQEGQARAKYDFNAQNQVEMSIRKGEVIIIIRRVDKNWYEGKIGARRGILPVAYVEILKEPGTDYGTMSATPAIQTQSSLTAPLSGRPMEPTFVPKSVSSPTVRQATSPSWKSGSVQEGSDRETFGDNVLKEFKTQVSQSLDGPSSTLRRNSVKSSIDELLIPPPPTTSIQEELELLRKAPERCRVLYAYRKQHEDELELREGETIEVLERCDDGWFNGRNKRGDQGYFPGNYVQSL